MCWYLPCSPRNSPSTVCNGRTIGGIRTRPSAVVPLRALRKSFPLTGLDDLWTENPPQEVPERLTKQCLSGGSCRLRAPTAHWFPGTLFERNWKLHVDEDKLEPGMEVFHEPRDRLYRLFAADRGMESAESEVYTCCPLVETSFCC